MVEVSAAPFRLGLRFGGEIPRSAASESSACRRPSLKRLLQRGSDGWAGHQRMSAPRKRTRVAAARGLDMAAVAAATTPPVRLSRQGRCCWTRGQTSVLLLALIYSLGCWSPVWTAFTVRCYSIATAASRSHDPRSTIRD
ncbi:hypothetical protein F441_11079 [Phytophthora nicotianae CJ01A1]|uniref:Uncharacterized protein n=4 Tax=Phytophthora nicotianae TaxID=4792 RepID=W2Z4W1_PHYNI|nr:hypothetical protein L915_10878 [Phytophthora nicotianae]ETO72776.1 hypothetical protein F444_11227 [Phytophthora nicotianae P1976]ETP13949.1 hypothetical protein F441_11079 [Phytophthora nicotianae CJ01A1]ETP42006.1 hypothetical protein F442_11076 [Phytophthora nicotianae P10297]ETL37556.1 hypothetical protein L916_10771 [Phytophthora nicotianae]